MNKENTEKLWSSFPNLYADKDASIRVSLIPFGFETGDGWFQLIWDLSKTLEKEILLSDENKKYCRAVQVKEKYGLLRYSMTVSTDKMDELINEAVKKSKTICEECGKEGALISNRGWLSVKCNEHRPGDIE